MSNETYIKKLNNFLTKKTYSYKDDTFSFDYTIELTGEIKPMITIGEWTDYNLVIIKIFNLSDVLKRILSFMLEKDPEYSELKKNDIYDVKVPLRRLGIERHLGASAKKMLKTLNINSIMTKEVLLPSSELEGDYERITIDEQKKNINEGMIDRLAVRTVVRDIISIVKRKETGTWYLPEDINDEIEYEFENTLSGFNVELYLEHKDDIGGYAIPNAFFSSTDDVIELYLEYNPETIEQQLYDLIGELNEIITHELVHLKQRYTTGLKYKDVDRGALEYYTRKHEIPAQYYGYKRLSKLTKQPFENVVRNWFDTHRKIHRLTPDEEEIVIQRILNYKP